MKKKIILLILSAITGLYIISTASLVAEEDITEDIRIENNYPSDRKGPVDFSHLIHAEDYEVECDACHHEYEGNINMWDYGDPVKKCQECHIPSKNIDNLKNLRLSFHLLCKNCHKDLAKEGISEDAPYRKCSGCHVIE